MQQINSYHHKECELQNNLFDLNLLITKINQTVSRAEQQNNHLNVQNLVTEIDEIDNISGNLYKTQKISQPIHQLHKKNKLSTVVQESITTSEMASARLMSFKEIQEMGQFRTSRRISCGRSKGEESHKKLEILNQQQNNPLGSKKILGVKRTSQSSTPAQKSPIHHQNYGKFRRNSQQSLNKKIQRPPRPTLEKSPFLNKNQKFYPTRKCIGLKNIVCRKDEQIHKTSKSKSKQKRGLSVLSKKNLKSEENCKSGHKGNRKNMTQMNSSEKKQNKQQKITIKKKYVSDFNLQQNNEKCNLAKQQYKNKLKSCLTRTNIMDFYTKSRIRK